LGRRRLGEPRRRQGEADGYRKQARAHGLGSMARAAPRVRRVATKAGAPDGLSLRRKVDAFPRRWSGPGPRTSDGGGRSPGSRVTDARSSPSRPKASGAARQGGAEGVSPLTVAGTAADLGQARTAFPLGSLHGNRRPQSHSGICRAGKSNFCGMARRIPRRGTSEIVRVATNRPHRNVRAPQPKLHAPFAIPGDSLAGRLRAVVTPRRLPLRRPEPFAKPALAAFHVAPFLVLPFLLFGVGCRFRGTTTAR